MVPFCPFSVSTDANNTSDACFSPMGTIDLRGACRGGDSCVGTTSLKTLTWFSLHLWDLGSELERSSFPTIFWCLSLSIISENKARDRARHVIEQGTLSEMVNRHNTHTQYFVGGFYYVLASRRWIEKPRESRVWCSASLPTGCWRVTPQMKTPNALFKVFFCRRQIFATLAGCPPPSECAWKLCKHVWKDVSWGLVLLTCFIYVLYFWCEFTLTLSGDDNNVYCMPLCHTAAKTERGIFTRQRIGLSSCQ